MAISKSTADREKAAAERAIGLGYVVAKFLGPDDFPYVLQTESGITLESLEELLDVLETGAIADRIARLQAGKRRTRRPVASGRKRASSSRSCSPKWHAG